MMPDPEYPPEWSHRWEIFAPLARRLLADRLSGDAAQVQAGHLTEQEAAARATAARDIASVWDAITAGQVPPDTSLPASAIAADLATAIARIEDRQTRMVPEKGDEDLLPCMKALWWWMRPWPSGAPHITELARLGLAQPGRWLLHPTPANRQRNAA